MLKAVGVKGLVAIIVMVIIAILASYAGGFNPNVSSLPYASQTAVSNVASQVTTQAVSRTTMDTIKNFAIETLKSSLDVSLRSGLTTALNTSFQAISQLQQEEQSHIQNLMQEDNKQFLKHMKELDEKREEFQARNASYDSIQVLKELVNNFKVQNPETQLQQLLDVTDVQSSYAYLESFLTMKLNLDVNTFDSVGSLDFSLPLHTNT